MTEKDVCEYAYASVDGTRCEFHAGIHNCPANYASIYTAENCPNLKEIDKEYYRN
jgi:hypothetical protein